MSETFFRGRDTGSIFARLPNGNFMILHGRGAFANQEGGILRRSDVMAGNGVKLIETPAASLWVCFHCGDTFTDDIEAREHFGPTMDSEPICQVTAERYREVERRLVAYENESDATARTFYDIGHRAAVEARDAEQKGYDRGIADANAMIDTDLRERDCYHCQGEGRVIRLGAVYEPGCGHPHWGDVDEGPCRVCDETGRIWDEAPLIDFEELEDAFGYPAE